MILRNKGPLIVTSERMSFIHVKLDINQITNINKQVITFEEAC